MLHDTPLISTIVAGLVLAFIFGAIANRLRMPPLVGYLVAGVVVGPYTPGFVADSGLASQLSELGVILLMFGVGLHFSLKDLLSVRAIAVPGAIVQITGATAMGLGLAMLLGWSIGAGLIFGLALSVASTVVLLKALQDRHIVESERGRIAVGWLIVEDIAMVLALVLIPALSGLMGGTAGEQSDPFINLIERLLGTSLNIWGILGITIVKLAAFVGVMLVVGRRLIPWGLHMTAHTGSRELFRLAVLAIALGVAAGSSYLFGVSLALGAFFAGMILSESELSNRAAQETLPLRDAFAVLFFVSVGMLFDPTILLTEPLPVLGTVFIILIGKSVLAFLIGLVFRQPVGTALTISASLAQIGEFSFILASLGVSLAILPPDARDLILAGALISIVLNPVIFYISEAIRPDLEARSAAKHPTIVHPNRAEPTLESAAIAAVAVPQDVPDLHLPTTLEDHVVLVGYGSVGEVVAEGLKQRGAAFLLIEDSEKRVAAARRAGIEVVVGNAAATEPLALANIAGARALIVAIPNAFEVGQVVEQSRHINQKLLIVARAHSDEEGVYLRDLGANEVLMGAREIALGMLAWAVGREEPMQMGLTAVARALDVEAPAAAMAEGPKLPAAASIIAVPERTPAGAASKPAAGPPAELVEAGPELELAASAAAELADVPTFWGAELSAEAPPEPASPPEPDASIPGPLPRSRAAGPATSPAMPFRAETLVEDQ